MIVILQQQQVLNQSQTRWEDITHWTRNREDRQLRRYTPKVKEYDGT